MNFNSQNRLATGLKTILLAATLVFAAGNMAAQSTQNMTIAQSRTTLSELFRQIERQTGQVVIFNASDVEANRTVSVARRVGTLSEILDGTLPAAGYAWQRNGRYIVVIEAPRPAPTVAPQPSQADLERAIGEYTRRNIPTAERAQTTVRYDTVRTVKPDDGIFHYPSRTVTPELTGRTAATPFTRDTSPLLAVKTNLVWWAAGATPNLAGEMGLGRRTTLEIAGGNNRWNRRGTAENNKKMVHWVVKPEFRYWLCERFGTGSFSSEFTHSTGNITWTDTIFPCSSKRSFATRATLTGRGSTTATTGCGVNAGVWSSRSALA